AGIHQAGLALRRDPGGLRRRLPALVRRHRPADVLLLRRDDGAVPGACHRNDPGRHPPQAEPELRAANVGAHRRVLLYRGCDHEFRLDVSHSDGDTDLAVNVEHGDLAAQLAIALATLRRTGICGRQVTLLTTLRS